MTATCKLPGTASLALLLLLLLAPRARAVEPRTYLSWHAPYGTPGATDNISFTCGDGVSDTLFLTYETGADTGQFCGLEAEVHFRVPAPDSLGSYWRSLENDIECEFLPDSIHGATRPWRGSLSLRFSFFDYANGIGRLQLSHVRPPLRPVTVRDSLPYFYARVVIPHPPAGQPRCDQPICIEWAGAQFIMDTTAATSVYAGKRGHPYVTMNSPNGAVCASFLPAVVGKKPETWRPKPDAKGKGKKSR